MSFRRAARTDANHKEIVKAFRDLGWSVQDISQLKNCCDLFVSKAGRTIAVEVKDGSKPPSARKLSEGEIKFMEMWQGEYSVVLCIDDVISLNKTISI
jgi:Holliday junction resolvase